MTHVLYIEGSPRKDRSASIEIAQAALSALRASDDRLTIDTLDTWSTDLPEFDGPAMEAKYAWLKGEPLTDAQAAAWAQIRALGARFLAADMIVLGAPLWNFSIPYKLKHLIDAVSQKDVLFTFDGREFGGLLAGRKALLILARGLDYGPGAGTPADTYDFQKPYLERWLRFLGISDVHTVVAQKTLFGADIDQAARDAASADAVAAIRGLRSGYGARD